jgi:ABC-2 type transport system permease protein
MSDAGLVAHQVRAEQKLFWRNPTAAMFSFILPILFLVVFATFNSDTRVDARGGIEFATFLVPGIIAFAVMTTTYQNLAIVLTIQRDGGVLKRLRGTPLPPWAYIAGRLGSAAITSLLLVAVTLAIGVVVYGVDVRAATLPGLAITLLVGIACFSVLGVAITGVIPHADAAPAVVNALLLPLVFVSGIFFPSESAPGWLETVASVFPVQHLAHALQLAFDPATAAPGLVGGDLLVLGLWAVAGLVVAIRTFRWEPARG